MTNPTSNFGWQMPTSTDLVTDLPADFEVFGQAVDTDFVDLLGGTTGQVLSKTSATDLDFTWINNDTGDITGVTAGTGITGGGTSGTVTVTNDMATTITAAGDIVVGTGSGTYDNLPIGTTAQVLTADTTVSPYKVKWATPASGGMTVISTGTLTSAGVTFSSIPGTYNDLRLTVTGYNAGGGRLRLRINGDTGSNYCGFMIRESNNTFTSYPYAAQTEIFTEGEVTPDGGATNTLNVTIPAYAATDGKKIIVNNSYVLFNTTFQVPCFNQWAWTGTTGAITSVSIISGSATAGTYTLYGVK